MSDFLINFRVWDITKEEYSTDLFYLSNNSILCHFDPVLHTIVPITDSSIYEVEYRTTHKSVDGIYIYENDIIERLGRLHHVKWIPYRNAFLCYDANYQDISFLDGSCKIVGNIHDGYTWERNDRNYYCEFEDLNTTLTQPFPTWIRVGNKIYFKREKQYGVIEHIHSYIVYVRVFGRVRRYTINYITKRTAPCSD